MDRIYSYSFYDHPITQIYRIRIADGDPRGGWYVQLSSIESFVERIHNRWYDHHQSEKGVFGRYHNSDSCDNEILNAFIGKVDYYRSQEISFDSVWDFYNHIGYNYKDKTMKTLDNLITNWKIEK